MKRMGQPSMPPMASAWGSWPPLFTLVGVPPIVPVLTAVNSLRARGHSPALPYSRRRPWTQSHHQKWPNPQDEDVRSSTLYCNCTKLDTLLVTLSLRNI